MVAALRRERGLRGVQSRAYRRTTIADRGPVPAPDSIGRGFAPAAASGEFLKRRLRYAGAARCHNWDTRWVCYVLGSETESMIITSGGIEYCPAGPAHAVDIRAPQNNAEPVIAYAICGAAVRVWADQAFDPDTGEVHDQCAAIARGA